MYDNMDRNNTIYSPYHRSFSLPLSLFLFRSLSRVTDLGLFYTYNIGYITITILFDVIVYINDFFLTIQVCGQYQKDTNIYPIFRPCPFVVPVSQLFSITGLAHIIKETQKK